MSILLTENCIGCGACIIACQPKSIQFKKTSQGFNAAYISEENCTACGRCKIVCPQLRKQVSGFESYYAYQNPNYESLQKSQSGGAFSVLAESILDQDGIVSGVRYDDSGNVIFIIIKNINDLQFCHGSKYVWADPLKILDPFISEVKKGRPALFCGLPCQVSAVRNLLKNRENLLLVDLLCYGPLSPELWKNFLYDLRCDPSSFSFRDKSRTGWECAQSSYIRKQNKIYIDRDKLFVNKIFQKQYGLNKSCLNCKYRLFNRPGDITIGDFWGIRNTNLKIPESVITNGISLIHFNTAKGEEYFQLFQNGILGKFNDKTFLLDHNGGYQPNKLNRRKYDRFWKIQNFLGVNLGLKILKCKFKITGKI